MADLIFHLGQLHHHLWNIQPAMFSTRMCAISVCSMKHFGFPQSLSTCTDPCPQLSDLSSCQETLFVWHQCQRWLTALVLALLLIGSCDIAVGTVFLLFFFLFKFKWVQWSRTAAKLWRSSSTFQLDKTSLVAFLSRAVVLWSQQWRSGCEKLLGQT